MNRLRLLSGEFEQARDRLESLTEQLKFNEIDLAVAYQEEGMSEVDALQDVKASLLEKVNEVKVEMITLQMSIDEEQSEALMRRQ